jgi:hypothetical protein
MESAMKILPFKPHSNQSTETSRNQQARQTNSNSSSDFEAHLSDFIGKPTNATDKTYSVMEKITSENILALQAVSPEDLNLAGSLLNTLLNQIQCAGPSSLQQVHNLDGILYYYQV